METTGVMMPDKKTASDCVAADESEFNESMKTTAPALHKSLAIRLSMQRDGYILSLTLDCLVLDGCWLKCRIMRHKFSAHCVQILSRGFDEDICFSRLAECREGQEDDFRLRQLLNVSHCNEL